MFLLVCIFQSAVCFVCFSISFILCHFLFVAVHLLFASFPSRFTWLFYRPSVVFLNLGLWTQRWRRNYLQGFQPLSSPHPEAKLKTSILLNFVVTGVCFFSIQRPYSQNVTVNSRSNTQLHKHSHGGIKDYVQYGALVLLFSTWSVCFFSCSLWHSFPHLHPSPLSRLFVFQVWGRWNSVLLHRYQTRE